MKNMDTEQSFEEYGGEREFDFNILMKIVN